jgi:hypothetical protein
MKLMLLAERYLGETKKAGKRDNLESQFTQYVTSVTCGRFVIKRSNQYSLRMIAMHKTLEVINLITHH